MGGRAGWVVSGVGVSGKLKGRFDVETLGKKTGRTCGGSY